MNYSPTSLEYYDEKRNRERVRINVSGETFETFEDTLARFPSTLLGSKSKRSQYFNSKRSEYCFNRDRAVFNAILFYYQSSGILSKPDTVSYEIFLKETTFFELETDCMGRPVIGNMSSTSSSSSVKWQSKKHKRTRTLRGRIWQSLENPLSPAEILVNKLSGLITLLSLAALCWDTIPPDQRKAPPLHNNTKTLKSNFNNNSQAFYSEHQFFFLSESIFSGWFTIEYMARLFTTPKPFYFLISFSAVVDLLSIVPFYIAMAMGFSHEANFSPILRLPRLIRILKLKRYSTSVRLLFETITDSWKELQVFFLSLVFITVIMSSAIYHVEGLGENTQFVSVPDVFWYSVVTLSSVGYGDYVPKTEFGKLIGAFFCISGVVLIFCFSPVLFAKFRRCRYRLFKEQVELQIYREELGKIYNQNVTEKKRKESIGTKH